MRIKHSLVHGSGKRIATIIATAGLMLSLNLYAGGAETMATPLVPATNTENFWSVSLGAGYTNYSNMYSSDGQTPVARLALDRSFYHHHQWQLGIEGGVQTGNTMRLENSEAGIALLGGTFPIETTIKPMLDLLATVKKTFAQSRFFLQGKIGMAYRRWQFDNTNVINDLSCIDLETQVGFGYDINSKTNLSVLYQNILGGNPNLTANSDATAGTVSDIPTQNGALLNLSIQV